MKTLALVALLLGLASTARAEPALTITLTPATLGVGQTGQVKIDAKNTNMTSTSVETVRLSVGMSYTDNTDGVVKGVVAFADLVLQRVGTGQPWQNIQYVLDIPSSIIVDRTQIQFTGDAVNPRMEPSDPSVLAFACDSLEAGKVWTTTFNVTNNSTSPTNMGLPLPQKEEAVPKR